MPNATMPYPKKPPHGVEAPWPTLTKSSLEPTAAPPMLRALATSGHSLPIREIPPARPRPTPAPPFPGWPPPSALEIHRSLSVGLVSSPAPKTFSPRPKIKTKKRPTPPPSTISNIPPFKQHGSRRQQHGNIDRRISRHLQSRSPRDRVPRNDFIDQIIKVEIWH